MNHPIQDWHAQRVWIIGASSGIGRATAELLLQKGATVAISARNQAALDEIVQAYPNAVALAVDVNKPDSLQAAYQQFCVEHPLDLYLHCAADYQPMRAWEMNTDRMQRSMMINYGGVLNALDVVLPNFLARKKGRIVVIASVAGYMGLPKALAYGPTKAALINLCESLYLDLKPRGIDVQVVNPGFVATPLTADNDFDMPDLITAEQAAIQLVRGLESSRFEISFPKRFTSTLKLIKRLPYGLKLRLLSKIESVS